MYSCCCFFFFSSRRRHTRFDCDWSSDVCSSDLDLDRRRQVGAIAVPGHALGAALAPDARTLFVTTNLDRLCAVSVTARTVIAAVQVPQVCTELTLDRAGRRIYLPTWRAGLILELDSRAPQTLRTFRVGGTVQGVSGAGA